MREMKPVEAPANAFVNKNPADHNRLAKKEPRSIEDLCLKCGKTRHIIMTNMPKI